jgi:hypothetical protein
MDMVLRMHKWAVEIKRVSLASITLPDNAPYNYAYSLPNDLVRIIDLVPESPNDTSLITTVKTSRYIFIVEGDTLYTNETPAILRYVSDPENSIRDSLLCRAIALDIAAYLAVDVLGNETKQASMQGQFIEVLKLAKSISSDESANPDEGEPYWLGGSLRADRRNHPW